MLYRLKSTHNRLDAHGGVHGVEVHTGNVGGVEFLGLAYAPLYPDATHIFVRRTRLQAADEFVGEVDVERAGKRRAMIQCGEGLKAGDDGHIDAGR